MNEKPEIKDYFSENWLDKQPFFKDVFSRDRFLQIFWAFHLCAPDPNRPHIYLELEERKSSK